MPNIINKVVYDGNVLIDLTSDTVTAGDVLQGVTVHLADGTVVTGTMIATSTPTADTISKWDSNARMNSTDMSQVQIDAFVASLNCVGMNSAWCFFQKGGYTANNTATQVTGVNISQGGDASCFQIGTDQVTVKQAGTYKVSISFCLSAVTTEANCKKIILYKNGAETAVAVGRKPSWENCANVAVTTFAKDDVLTMWKRAEDGNSTFTASAILIERLA